MKNHVQQLLSVFHSLSQKVSIRDQFSGVKDRYNNIQYILRKLFICGFAAEGAVIYIYYRMHVFILKKKKFCCCYSYYFVKNLQSPGILSKFLEKS